MGVNCNVLIPPIRMRKLPLLLGTLGGAMAGYLFSNKKLREELSSAKDAEAAGKILAKHLQHDGQQIGAEVQKFVKSDVIQDNFGKAKKMATQYGKKLKGEMSSFMKSGMKKMKKAAPVRESAPRKSAMKKAA